MNKFIRIAIWAFIVSILASGIALTKRAFAEDVNVLSRQYNLLFTELLVKKVKTIDKGSPVVIYFKDGSEVAGIYKGYSGYDDSLWIKVYGDWLQSGYDLNELQDVRVKAKEPV